VRSHPRGPGRRCDGGQATVELALCLPVVALVLAAVVEVGALASDQARLWHSAREAARVAAVDPDVQGVAAAATAAGLEDVELVVRPPPTYRIQGDPVTVELSYKPRAGVILLAPVVERMTLSARATMRVEQP
jgi:Flp pilus assembly protein TadG